VRARAVGMSRGGIGAGFFADLDEPLRILVLQSCIMVCFYLCFLLIVGLLGFFEDVDEVFALGMLAEHQCGEVGETYGADDFPGLVDYCDRLHERHVGGSY